MTYQAFARKWRPHDFEELVGQTHVRRALVNALRDQRIHPAYLFTGTRGVGKTTLARILAKCLNCETGITPEPCGVCSACREIDQGNFIDLIEVDAASRTRVEDTRELLDNVQYAPTRGRYKIYLIDEVHMLSGHSFNALLKTLEEPPPHVQFLLATTDPQKLPATVLSRCIQFGLKRIPEAAIAEQLTKILEQEGLKGEPFALRELARAADGSMRDGLSLLDQAVAYGGGEVRESDVRDMLGTIPRDAVIRLIKAMASDDAPLLLDIVDQLASQSVDFSIVLADLLSALHRIAVCQFKDDVEVADATEMQVWAELAAVLNPEDVQLYYQIALMGRRDLSFAVDTRSGLEMTLLRMLAFRPGNAEQSSAASPMNTSLPERPKKSSDSSSVAGNSRQPQYAQQPVQALETNHTDDIVSTPDLPESEGGAQWASRVAALNLMGLAGQLANNSRVLMHQEGYYRLGIDRASKHLCTEMARQRLTQALSSADGRDVRVEFEVLDEVGETPAVQADRKAANLQLEAEQAIETDQWIQSLRAQMGAKIVPGSVRPRDDVQDVNDSE